MNLGESYVTVSISEPFHKTNGAAYRYKLIAAIIHLAEQEE